MTGYGSATTALGPRTLTVQVSSVNRKTLDLSVSLPDEWESLEPAIGATVRRASHTPPKYTTKPTTGRAVAKPSPRSRLKRSIMLTLAPIRTR